MSQSTNLTQQVQKPKFSVAISSAGYQKLINNTLGDPKRAQRFVAAITSAVAVNPVLQECEPGTILAGALLGESLNLSPSPQLGQYYLVPFDCKVKGPDGKTVYLKDSNGAILKDDRGRWIAQSVKNAQFVLGYRGYIQLAIRSGMYKKLNVLEIKEGELINFDELNEEIECQLIEDSDEREKAPTIGYYAMFEYINGFRKAIYWSKKKMEHHADTYSPAFSMDALHKIENGEIPENEMWKYSSFWYKSFDDMAKKTLLRQIISKWGVMSSEMQTAYESDADVPATDDNYTTPDTLNVPPLSTPTQISDASIPQAEATDTVEKIDLNNV